MTLLAALRAHPLTTLKTDRHATVSANGFAAFMAFHQTTRAYRMGFFFTDTHLHHLMSAGVTAGQNKLA